jgi:hypothetical protein
MNNLYLECIQTEVDVYYLTTDSYVAIFLWRLLRAENDVKLTLINSNADYDTSKCVPVNLKNIDFDTKIDNNDSIYNNNKSKLPLMIMNDNHYLIGLCCVLRGLCRSKNSEFSIKLLGFKENCLMAPSEFSPWTRFCEREMISCCEQIRISDNVVEQLPEEFIKFERDLGNPMRIHNIYKHVRELKNDKSIKSGEKIELDHKFCHGNKINLSDVILYSLFKLMLTTTISDEILNVIPMTKRWIMNVELIENNFNEVFHELINIKLATNKKHQQLMTFIGEVPKIDDGSSFSILQRDPTSHRKNRNKKLYTKQLDVDIVMKKLKTIEIEISSKQGDPNQSHIDDSFIIDLLTTGELPEKRLENKKSQLKSLAVEVLKLARPKDVIVDFCSGTGHLGLLIAQILPNCSIIILENKEESVNRARMKASKLQLDNVKFYQCNLVSISRDINIARP